jgi:hypothetical protein
MNGNGTNIIITMPAKSMGLSIFLTLVFGSFGLLYSSILGFFVMLLLDLVVGGMTLGVGLIITHPIAMIWGIIAVKRYNSNLIR